MRRRIGIVLLAAGTLLGFGWGFARMAGYCPYGSGCHGRDFYGHGPWGEHERALEDHAADACVRAAARVLNAQKTAPPAVPATPSAPAPTP